MYDNNLIGDSQGNSAQIRECKNSYDEEYEEYYDICSSGLDLERIGDKVLEKEFSIDSLKNQWIQNELDFEGLRDLSGMFVVSLEFGKNDGPLLPPDSRFWHRNGDVHYFHYEWPEDPYAINDDAPFQLLDIDFDGKKELLVNGGDFCREGFAQIIYRLKGNRIVPADDLPFTYVRMSDTKLDPDKKRILLSSSDVWSYACFFLTKTDKPISIQKKPAFKTSHAKWLWNESDFSKNNNVFVLDSIYERDEIYDPYSDWDNRMDSCWEYKRVGKEMKLVKSRKMRHE